MKYEVIPSLQRIFSKLRKKDPVAYQAVWKKIREIVESGHPEHYKPLRYDLKNRKRVHILSSFVLVFEYDQEQDCLFFLDYDHHDDIYKRH